MKGVEAKPHLRFIFGYWRVSAVPVKWHKLTPQTQDRFRRAHEAVGKENAKLQEQQAWHARTTSR